MTHLKMKCIIRSQLRNALDIIADSIVHGIDIEMDKINNMNNPPKPKFIS